MFEKNGNNYWRLLILFYGTIVVLLLGIREVTNKFSPQEINNWSNLATIGQFLIEFFLIPIALVTFFQTLQDLRSNQIHANLDIFWNSDSEYNQVYRAKLLKSKEYSSNTMMLTNTGNNPAIFYQIIIDVPKEFWFFNMSDNAWFGRQHNGFERFTYQGSANNISFPDSPIDLGKINFSDSSKLPQKLILPYYISSDKSNYKKGELIILFEK